MLLMNQQINRRSAVCVDWRVCPVRLKWCVCKQLQILYCCSNNCNVLFISKTIKDTEVEYSKEIAILK